jgi:RNA polymerase sigma-70 factor (ECF subfamily)
VDRVNTEGTMEEDFHRKVRMFYEANRQGLFTYALSMTRDREAAEDAVQAAVCRLLRRGRMPAEPRPYVFRSVRNAVVDVFRRRGNDPEPLLDVEAAGRDGHDPGLIRLLEQCLGRLSEPERETVVLKALNGMTFREIAAVRRRTVATVASRYRRGLEKMRKMLEDRG